jgi:CubicO group peptidase (beta-lactamase class C family)
MSQEFLATPLETQLDALFGQYTAADQSRGLVYGLVGASGLVHSAGFGVANDAGDVPGPDTVFPIASMTKSFVAAGALLARDRGLVNLDAPITDFFAEFTAGFPAGGNVGNIDDAGDAPTLRMLLSMGGGLTEDNSWVDPFIDMPVADLLAIVSRGLSYSNPPGTTFEYSNLGYTLAGLAVGKAVGRPIETWVRDELLVPLGLDSTRFDNDEEFDAAPVTRATGYSLNSEGAWVGFPRVASGAFAAAGGICSTVRDLASWVHWLGAAFRPADGTDPGPLRRASRREMQHIHQLNLPALATRVDGALSFTVSGYGLGLSVREDLLRGTFVTHSGGLPGFILNMIWHPDSGEGVVVLTNSHRNSPIPLSEEALFRALDRRSAPARTVHTWPATRDLQGRTEELIRRWDDDLAGEIFAENIDFDRPLADRRDHIAELIDQVGPLTDPRPGSATLPDLVSAVSPADVTWAIPGERGELICMIHLTPTTPPKIQELEVRAAPYGTPRGARPTDISPRRKALGVASLSSLPNTAIDWPQ